MPNNNKPPLTTTTNPIIICNEGNESSNSSAFTIPSRIMSREVSDNEEEQKKNNERKTSIHKLLINHEADEGKYPSITDNEGYSRSQATTPSSVNDQSAQLPLYKELIALQMAMLPNDIGVSAQFLFANYLISHLNGYSRIDASIIALVAVVTHTCIRIVASSPSIAAYVHEGIQFEEDDTIRTDDGAKNHFNRMVKNFQTLFDSHGKLTVHKNEFKLSMAAMLKAESQSAILGMTLFLATPLLYYIANIASKTIVRASYNYVFIAAPSILFQTYNAGFQITLSVMHKRSQMAQAGLINALLTCSLMCSSFLFKDPLNKIRAIATSFVLGSMLMSCLYARYFAKKRWLPSLTVYWEKEKQASINRMHWKFVKAASMISLQLVSELGAVFMQPFYVRLFSPQEYRDDILAVLNGTSNLNVFTIVPAIPASIATNNIIMKSIAFYNQTKNPHYLNQIRHTLLFSMLIMLTFSSLMTGALTASAPQIANLFYDPNDITMPGLTSDPYAVIGITEAGTTVDYLRNLFLFVGRLFGLNDYGTAVSWLSLWVLYPPLVAAFSQIQNAGVFSILDPYYLVITIGTLILGYSVYDCVKDNEKLGALINKDDPKHTEEWSKKSSILCCQFFNRNDTGSNHQQKTNTLAV